MVLDFMLVSYVSFLITEVFGVLSLAQVLTFELNRSKKI